MVTACFWEGACVTVFRHLALLIIQPFPKYVKVKFFNIFLNKFLLFGPPLQKALQ